MLLGPGVFVFTVLSMLESLGATLGLGVCTLGFTVLSMLDSLPGLTLLGFTVLSMLESLVLLSTSDSNMDSTVNPSSVTMC